jgi:hypothetical protein
LRSSAAAASAPYGGERYVAFPITPPVALKCGSDRPEARMLLGL